jgi:hypothetical protein
MEVDDDDGMEKKKVKQTENVVFRKWNAVALWKYDVQV